MAKTNSNSSSTTRTTDNTPQAPPQPQLQHMQLQLPLPLPLRMSLSLSIYLSPSFSLPLCLSSVDKQLCKFYNFPWRVVFVRADDFLIATAFGISRLLRLPASLSQRFVVTLLPPFPFTFSLSHNLLAH